MRALILLSILTVCAGWAVVHELPDEEVVAVPTVAPQQVLSIALDGKDLPFASLRASLSTRVGEQLDDHRLVRDRAALEAALIARGYADANVSAPTIAFAKSGGAFVTFDIAQGPLYRIGNVKITGVADRDRDSTGVLTLGTGDDANPLRIEGARLELADNLARHGRPLAVEARQSVDRATASVDIELAVH